MGFAPALPVRPREYDRVGHGDSARRRGLDRLHCDRLQAFPSRSKLTRSRGAFEGPDPLDLGCTLLRLAGPRFQSHDALFLADLSAAGPLRSGFQRGAWQTHTAWRRGETGPGRLAVTPKDRARTRARAPAGCDGELGLGLYPHLHPAAHTYRRRELDAPERAARLDADR